MLKTYLKSYGYLFGIILIGTILLSIINYFFKIPSILITVVIPIISLLVASVILGKNCKEKAYIEGVKFSAGYLILITILKLIFKTAFNYKAIIMYLIILFTCVIGSMIEINMKKN